MDGYRVNQSGFVSLTLQLSKCPFCLALESPPFSSSLSGWRLEMCPYTPMWSSLYKGFGVWLPHLGFSFALEVTVRKHSSSSRWERIRSSVFCCPSAQSVRFFVASGGSFGLRDVAKVEEVQGLRAWGKALLLPQMAVGCKTFCLYFLSLFLGITSEEVPCLKAVAL